MFTLEKMCMLSGKFCNEKLDEKNDLEQRTFHGLNTIKALKLS